MQIELKLKIGKAVITLSQDEAQELYNALETMFGPKQTISIPPVVINPPRPYPWREVWYSEWTGNTCAARYVGASTLPSDGRTYA